MLENKRILRCTNHEKRIGTQILTCVQPKQKNQPEPFFFILTIDES